MDRSIGTAGWLLVAQLLALVYVAGCTPRADNADAEEAWSQMVAGIPIDRERFAIEDGSIFKEIERSSQFFRSRGVEFWSAFPSDSRRYDWLMMTVALSPEYPVDIDRWAAAEAGFLNPEPVSDKQRQRWDARYVVMRDYFLNSSETTREDRDFLLALEVRNSLLGATDAFARSGEFDAENLAREIQGYFERTVDQSGKRSDVAESGAEMLLDVYLLTLIELSVPSAALHELLTSFEIPEGSRVGLRVEAELKSLAETDRLASDRWGGLGRAFRTVVRAQQIRRVPEGHRLSGLVAAHERQLAYHRYRQLGIDSWPALDTDEKAVWLVNTLWPAALYPENWLSFIGGTGGMSSVGGGENIRAEEKWESLVAVLLRELEVSEGYGNDIQERLEVGKLRRLMWTAQKTWNSRNDRSNSVVFLRELSSFLQAYPHNSNASLFLRILVRDLQDYGIDEIEIRHFLKPLRSHSNDAVRLQADAYHNLLDLYRVPFELSGETLSGDMLSISDFRGRYLLIQHWATNCASCIERMPGLRQIHAEFAEHGLEVLSIVYDGKTRRRLVDRIRQEAGYTWPTIVGDDHWSELSDRFGWRGTPQYMLLDDNGLLIASTSELSTDDRVRDQVEALISRP